MFYTAVQSRDGWLIVFYTKTVGGERRVFEVSSPQSARLNLDEVNDIANQRLKQLVKAANEIGARFP